MINFYIFFIGSVDCITSCDTLTDGLYKVCYSCDEIFKCEKSMSVNMCNYNLAWNGKTCSIRRYKNENCKGIFNIFKYKYDNKYLYKSINTLKNKMFYQVPIMNYIIILYIINY